MPRVRVPQLKEQNGRGGEEEGGIVVVKTVSIYFERGSFSVWVCAFRTLIFTFNAEKRLEIKWFSRASSLIIAIIILYGLGLVPSTLS